MIELASVARDEVCQERLDIHIIDANNSVSGAEQRAIR